MENLMLKGLGVIGVLVLLIILKSMYKISKSNEALIINGSFLGKGKKSKDFEGKEGTNVYTDKNGSKLKILKGGGTFVIPIIQKASVLSLQSMKIEAEVEDVLTEKGVPLTVSSTVMIKIGSSIDMIARASEQYLGKKVSTMIEESEEVLEGHLRSILGTMTVEEIYQNREKFSQSVQDVASTDLAKMGLEIISFTIKEIKDGKDANNYLSSLGQGRISEAKKDADIIKQNAEKETAINKEIAERESEFARLERETVVAEANKEKELKLAMYKEEQDTARAKSESAYGIQEAIQNKLVIEEQLKADLVKKQKEIEIKDAESKIAEKEYNANVRVKAEAEKYAREQDALADKFVQEQKAEAEAIRIQKLGESEANSITLKGQAEADSIKAKAEALKLMDEAGKLQMVLDAMPNIISESVKPYANIKDLKVYDGIQTLQRTSMGSVFNGFDVMKDFTGMDIKEFVSTGIKNTDLVTKQVENLKDVTM